MTERLISSSDAHDIDGPGGSRFLSCGGLVLWAVLILAPLAILFACSIRPAGADYIDSARMLSLTFKTFGLAAIIALSAVVLGYIPGRLLATSTPGGKDIVLLLLLLTLVLPRYMLYYAWSLLLDPTTQLGRFLAVDISVARFVASFTTTTVLVMWYWPVAALLIAQGWKNIDSEVWDSSCLEAGAWMRFKNITLPLLARPMLLAFGVCFVLSMSEFTTFHLAGVETVGTELGVLYELSGSEGVLARAAWPISIVAVAAAIILSMACKKWTSPEIRISSVESRSQKGGWSILAVLTVFSLIAPVVLLVVHLRTIKPFTQFIKLHLDELCISFLIAACAAILSHLIAYGALALRRRRISVIINATIFLAMFLPASVIAISLLKMFGSIDHFAGLLYEKYVSDGYVDRLQQSWFIVSAGHACRFSGVALVILLLTKGSHRRHLSEMAALDGASRFKTWLYVHLPCTWQLLAGSFLLIVMFSVTEISATMVLLPAGLANFAQRLLNQMHYARDQQVIASCLILIASFGLLAFIAALLFRGIRLRRFGMLALCVFFVCTLGISGCYPNGRVSTAPDVDDSFGRTGRGAGEFVYPRAIDIAADQTVAVIDKTGRLQRFTPKGECKQVINMPQIDKGKPIGLSFAPNGNLYVADTHYHRVLVYSDAGEIVSEFGEYGKDDGCFIYPTDVAFSGDGRIFVGEYGGNDRISVFDKDGKFLSSFGSFGCDEGQLSRPASLCSDISKKILYVADACNHRIAVYDFDGNLKKYIGSPGTGIGQLRYPYDLTILKNGDIAVCEYGNNRIQLFDPEGNSVGMYGSAGRELGQLAYPWAVAADKDDRIFIVDAGNNRVQVWEL